MASKSVRDGVTTQFRSVTNATLPDAQRILKKVNYKLEHAIEMFYGDQQAMRNANKGDSGQESQIRSKLEKIFDRYANPADKTRTNIDGTLAFCADLEVDPEDPVVIVVAMLCKSPSMGEFTRSGFVDGWTSARKDSIEGMQAHLIQLRGREGFGDEETFRKVYNFTFDWAKQPGQRSLQCDTAIALWSLLLPLSTAPTQFTNLHLELWTEFLNGPYKSKAISKDSWTLFLDFWKTSRGDLSEHDLDAAWPSVIDDFVEWARPKLP
ncbi:DUF298-domain-containing protein [Atractiella rhizophila]|nr:DUF298-domain-containing protein [Atractiella rhizophila]